MDDANNPTILSDAARVMAAAKSAARILGAKGAAKGGRSRSPKKVAAVRENGKLGGRPRRQPEGVK